MTDLVRAEEITENKIVEYLSVMGLSGDLRENEQKQFIEIATAYQLNPFKREIYCVAYNTKQGRKLSIITGYEVYLKRAERTGNLNGWKTDVVGKREDSSLKAVVTIHRKDWSEPFTHEAYWFEYKQDNQMWNSKPITMIKKVAIAQAFRMCFPDEFAGIPYTSDELPDEMTQPKDVTPVKTETQGTNTSNKTSNVDADIFVMIDGSAMSPADKASLKQQYSAKPTAEIKKAFYEGCIFGKIKAAGKETVNLVTKTMGTEAFDDTGVPFGFQDDPLPPPKQAVGSDLDIF